MLLFSFLQGIFVSIDTTTLPSYDECGTTKSTIEQVSGGIEVDSITVSTIKISSFFFNYNWRNDFYSQTSNSDLLKSLVNC